MFARGAPAHSVLRTQAGLAPSPRCRASSTRPSEVAAPPACSRQVAGEVAVGVVGEVAVGVVGQGLGSGCEVLVQRLGRVVLADVARGSRR